MDEKEFLHLKRFRRELHQHPELSGEEHQTAARILEEVNQLSGIEVQRIGTTGVLATYRSGKPGKTLLFRGDTDALPIQEVNEFEYRSQYPGISHKCGHDGHTISLLAALRLTLQDPPESGVVHFVFQPGEENGIGAQAVIDEEEKINPLPDHVFAYHNLPGYPLHQIVYRRESFTAAANSIVIKLHGKTSHAAEPEKGNNPGPAIAAIIQAFEGMNRPELDRPDFRVLTAVYATLGEKAYGISAGYGEIHYTLRSWSNEVMAEMEKECEARAKEIAEKYHLKPEISYKERFYANITEDFAVKQVEQTAERLGLDSLERDSPFKWGEDFGLFTERYSGAMFGIGSGEDHPSLHNPDYDFPDEIIPTAANMFHGILREILG